MHVRLLHNVFRSGEYIHHDRTVIGKAGKARTLPTPLSPSRCETDMIEVGRCHGGFRVAFLSFFLTWSFCLVVVVPTFLGTPDVFEYSPLSRPCCASRMAAAMCTLIRPEFPIVVDNAITRLGREETLRLGKPGRNSVACSDVVG